MRLLFPIAAALSLSGCWYDVKTPELIESPESWPNEVPIVPGGNCRDEEFAWVACTLDGDTFDINQCGDENGERIRMLGVAAPEIAHNDAPAECYGNESHDELRRLIEGQEVMLSFDRRCEGLYGRTLAYVWVPIDDDGDGEAEAYWSLNEYMIRQGYARVFPEEQFGAILLQTSFEQAQADAQSRGVGLWTACD